MTNQKPHRDLFDFADAVNRGDCIEPETELEYTYARVNRAMHANAMPGATRQQTWENVMTTLALHPQSNRTRRQRQSAAPHPRRYARWQWTPLANVALVAVLLLASFGAWQAFRPAGIGTPEPRPVAGLYAGVQTNQPATPQADMLANAGCDPNQSIPILGGVLEAPIEGQVIYTIEDTLYVQCNGDSTELATGVNDIYPMWDVPGILTYQENRGEGEAPTTHYLNVSNGESFATDFNQQHEAFPSIANTAGTTWLFATDEQGAMVLVDLRTMTTTPVTDLLGTDLPEGYRLIVSSAPDANTLAMAFQNDGPAETFAFDFTLDMPGDILLVHDDGTTTWVEVAEDTRGDTLLLSPDATSLAIAATIWGSGGMDVHVTMLSTESGEIYTEHKFEANEPLERVLWDTDGSMIYTEGNRLMRIAPTSSTEPETIYEHNLQLNNARTTSNPDVVVVTTRQDHGSDTEANTSDRDAVVSINLRDGSAQEFRGLELSAIWAAMYSRTQLAPAPLLLMYDWAGTTPGDVEVRVIDPTSGELVDTFITNNPNDQSGPNASGKNQMAVSVDGMTIVIATGNQLAVISATGEAPTFTDLETPANTPLSQAMMSINADGTMVAMSLNDEGRTRYLVDLTQSPPVWTKIPPGTANSNQWIGFLDPIAAP